jgi:hypothetical protein
MQEHSPREKCRPEDEVASVGALKPPHFRETPEGDLRPLPVDQYESARQMLEAQAELAAEYQRRLNTGTEQPDETHQQAIRAAERRQQIAEVLSRMVDARVILTGPQRREVLHMLDEVCFTRDVGLIPRLVLASIANYIHTCQLLENSYRASPDAETLPSDNA